MPFVKHRHDMMHRGQVPADQLAEGTPSPGDTPHYQYDGSVAWEPETGGGIDDQTAAEVTYDNSVSGLTASDVQDAIDELQALIARSTSLDVQLSVSGAYSLDLDTALSHDLTLIGNTTLSLDIGSEHVAGDRADAWALARQDGTGGWTLSVAGTITWATADGDPPDMPTDPNAALALGFVSLDDGATWFGFVGQASGSGGGASALDDLTDVTITTPAEGDLLRYDGSTWVNTTLRAQPMLDSAGGVQTDSAGHVAMHEVA